MLSVKPFPKVNHHLVSVNDQDVGEVIQRIKVQTGKISMYVLMCMEIQTSGSLRIGEAFTFGNLEFEVTGMSEGWYQVSTPEKIQKEVEIWNANMEVFTTEIHCK